MNDRAALARGSDNYFAADECTDAARRRRLRVLRETNSVITDRELPSTRDELAADDEAIAARGRRLWAALCLARSYPTFRSICDGKAVRCGGLDRFVLRRALRGGPLPDREAFILVDAAMLDSVAESGAFPKEAKR